MNKFKVGECPNNEGNRICTNGVDTYHNWNMEHTGGCYHCKKTLTRTIEDVQEDDLITDGEDFRRVLGRAGKAVFLTYSLRKGYEEKTSMYGSYSITELKSLEYSIVQDEPEPDVTIVNGKKYHTTELVERLQTLEEIK